MSRLLRMVYGLVTYVLTVKLVNKAFIMHKPCVTIL